MFKGQQTSLPGTGRGAGVKGTHTRREVKVPMVDRWGCYIKD